MMQVVDDGYHIVRLSGPVIIILSYSKSCYIWKCYVYYNSLLVLHKSSALNVLIKVHVIPTTRPIIRILNTLF